MKDHEKYAEEIVEKVFPFTPAEEEYEYPYTYQLAILYIQGQIESLGKATFGIPHDGSSAERLKERIVKQINNLEKSIDYLKEKL